MNGTFEILAAGVDNVRLPALRRAAPGVTAARPAPGLPEDAETSLRPGDDALLMIRPTGIVLLRPAEEPQHLTGRVADVAFRGRGYEYAIDLPGLARLTGVFARHRIDRGDEIGLRLDPEGCHLFAAAANHAEGDTPAPSLVLEV
jgi:iron(III) transport system ATP-binding protein